MVQAQLTVTGWWAPPWRRNSSLFHSHWRWGRSSTSASTSSSVASVSPLARACAACGPLIGRRPSETQRPPETLVAFWASEGKRKQTLPKSQDWPKPCLHTVACLSPVRCVGLRDGIGRVKASGYMCECLVKKKIRKAVWHSNDEQSKINFIFFLPLDIPVCWDEVRRYRNWEVCP